MYTLSAIFLERVGRHMLRHVETVPAGATCGEVVDRIGRGRASSVLVVDAGRRPLGIVTERDVARRIALRRDAQAPAADAMSAPVVTVCEDDPLYRAIARMRALGLRHVPVVDADGRAVGGFGLDAALVAALPRVVALVERIAGEKDLAGLERAKAAAPDLAAALLDEGLPAPEVLHVLGELDRDLHRRVTGLALAAMRADGRGEPPVPFSVIVMGSVGRGECFLRPDQDNGFILADYPDADHARVDGWFVELAARVTDGLERVGFPRCRGHVMATNPVWRKSLAQWRAQLAIWMRARSGVAVMYADIGFDFRTAWGDPSLAEVLRERVLALVRDHPGFLHDMNVGELDNPVALGFFGQLVADRDGTDARVDLKQRGTLPLIGAVRLLALRAGVAETSTLGRIDALARAGVLSGDERERLAGAYAEIAGLLLRQQLKDVRARRAVGNEIPVKRLARARREALVASLHAVDELQRKVRLELGARSGGGGARFRALGGCD